MTNLEALQSLVNLDLTNLHLKVLEDNSVAPYEIYTVGNKSIIELCSAYVYQIELTHPDFSEGKLRIAVDKDTLIKRMNAIFDKNGITSEMQISKPQIKFYQL